MTWTTSALPIRMGWQVLHDVDLHIRPGETVAVVGPSGGRKVYPVSADPPVLRRDCRCHPALMGRMCGQVTQESLRQNVGVVQQDVFLFAASVLENIRYGKPGATEEEVARAAQAGGDL